LNKTFAVVIQVLAITTLGYGLCWDHGINRKDFADYVPFIHIIWNVQNYLRAQWHISGIPVVHKHA